MVSFLLGFYVLLLVILNFSPTQQWLTHVVEETLERQLETEINIGQVEVGLFNRVTLHDLTIYDQEQQKLLQSGLVSAKIEWASLLRGGVTLRTVSLLDANIRLYQSTEKEKANFQFIVDAFSPKEKKEKKALNLCVNSVILRRCQLAYDKQYLPETRGKLNFSHIGVKNLDANISLKQLTSDSLNFRIRSLQFREKSGLEVRALSLRLSANRRHCDISHFELQMPGTRLAKENLQADYVLNGAQDFWPTLKVSGAFGDARIATDDVAFLYPKLRNLHQTFRLTTDFSITPKAIELRQLRVDELRNHVHLSANMSLKRKDGKVDYARAKVGRCFVDQLALVKLAELACDNGVPVAVQNIGNLQMDGLVIYNRDTWSTFKGKIDAGAGNVLADVKWKGKQVNGKADVQFHSLQQLFANASMPEKVNLQVKGSANFSQPAQPQANLQVHFNEATYRGYIYKDLHLQAVLKKGDLSALFSSSDPKAHVFLDFSSRLQGKEISQMRLKGDLRNFAPHELQLTDYFGTHEVSAQFEAYLRDLNWKNPQAELAVKDFKLSGDRPYLLERLNLSLSPSARGSKFLLNGDFGTANIDVPLSVDDFRMMLDNVIGYKFPQLASIQTRERQQSMAFNIDFSKSDFFTDVLHLPIAFDKGISAQGYLSANGKNIFVSAVADHLNISSTELTNVRVLLRERDNEFISRVKVNKRMGKQNMHFELDNASQQGKLLTELLWSDARTGRNKGTFQTETSIRNAEDIHTRILPTDITINDTIWKILPGDIHFQTDSIHIERFSVQHADQSLLLSGKLSNNPADSLCVYLTKIDVDYIMDLANIDDFAFSGLATGKASVSNTFSNLQLHAFLDVPKFHFNHGLMGRAAITGSWNIKDKRLNLFGDIREEGVGYTKVKGYVGLKEKELDLHIHSKNTNVFFLNKYVGDIFENLQGRTSGYCRVYGPFKQIDFGGQETASISARIGATGAKYTIANGQVAMTPGKFAFKDFKIYDGEGGTGKFNGHLLHHHLKRIRYHIDVAANQLKVYNKGQSLDMPFYATAYGTGSITLDGRPGLMEANINMRPDDKTVFVYTVDTPETFGDSQFLRIGNTADANKTGRTDDRAPEKPVAKEAQPSTLDIRLNFLIDMNPEATLKVIMDRKTGDHLLVHGYGPIKASFYNKGAFEMFGKLNVQRGIYKMSIQDVIRKDFEFTNGSYINFSGDPFMGDLGLRAVYTVNSASLSDLNIGNNLSENSVRVNCVLNFSGKVKSPQVSFDLELPTVSDDVQQMVRNLISSEEDMNMQILYLLGVGRFYTYNYSATEAASSQSQSAVAMKSFLSNTLSSQLNNIISNAVGSSNWSFGANLSTGSLGWSDMEVEGILSGRLLNNRLLINGNFGYRDRPTYSSTTNFIGDFDVRYLLTPGGGISLKAYSETNDRYFSKSSLTTQGIGIQLRRDFTNLWDLFRIRKRNRRAKPEKPDVPSDGESDSISARSKTDSTTLR